jgi:hypothetical protein
MKKSQAETTTARNLEEKFERGGDVLDYFEPKKARVIDPQSEPSSAKSKFAYPAKRPAKRPAVVREKSSHYRNKR